MSARRWPIYSMEVGDVIFVMDAPRCLRTKVYTYATEKGKKFSVRRAERFRVKSDLVIKRIA